jgi:hypothetical protein
MSISGFKVSVTPWNRRAGTSINQLDFLSSFLSLLTGAGAPQKKTWIHVQVSLTNSLSFSLFFPLFST